MLLEPCEQRLGQAGAAVVGSDVHDVQLGGAGASSGASAMLPTGRSATVATQKRPTGTDVRIEIHRVGCLEAVALLDLHPQRLAHGPRLPGPRLDGRDHDRVLHGLRMPPEAGAGRRWTASTSGAGH